MSLVREYDYRTVDKMVLKYLFTSFALVVAANCVSLSSIAQLWTNMDILEIQNFKNGFFESDLKVKRSNRTTFVIYGSVMLTDDISSIDMEMKFYYSSLGNNQYVLLPYKNQRKPICDYLESFFRKYVHSELEKVSDFPKMIENQPLCPLYIKKNYTVRGLYVPEDLMPRYFKAGTYKCEFNIFKSNVMEIQQTLIGVIKLY